MNTASDVTILSLRATETANPDLGLKQLLDALGPDYVARLAWGVGHLECFGGEAVQAFVRELDAAPKRRLLISGERLLELASTMSQTVDGVCVAYGSLADATEFLEKGWEGIQFGASPAAVAIEVIDGSLYDVYLRSPAVADRVCWRFDKVRKEDPANYLL